MKRILLILTSVLFLQNLYAQITIDDSVFYAPGDTVMTAVDNLPTGINNGNAGADQVWDFSSLQAPFTNQQIIRPAEEGVEMESFPTADIVVDLAGGESYFASESDAYLFLGYTGSDPAGLGLEIVASVEPASVIRRAPMNFLDINTDDYNINLPFSADLLPAEIFEAFPITPDSIRIRIESSRTDVVDAWGTMTIPGGEFEVLREKRIEYRDTRMDVKISVFPWQDITELVPFPEFFGTDTITTYNYFSNTAKEPIAVVTVSPDESSIEQVEYKSLETTTATTNLPTRVSDIIAYPNPAIDSARFAFSNVKAGEYALKIYNILGVVVWEEKYQVMGSKTVLVDLSKLRKGTYLYSIQDDEGKTLVTKRLIIIRP